MLEVRVHCFGDVAFGSGHTLGENDAYGEMRHGGLLLETGELEAEFLELAFKIAGGGVKVGIAAGGKLVGQLDEAILGGKTFDVLHGGNPFR
jgi:hypothetical protein